MDIPGTGFLARNLRRPAGRHPDTVALAAGVSRASGASDAYFPREAALLREVAERCVAGGQRLLFLSTAAAGMYGPAEVPRQGRHAGDAVHTVRRTQAGS
ncbi:hypothetical protein [Streptomyces sp. NBC_01794]|uniref:hypothetical protein n=1 Tax=Streptomyces sp. NBC_01794 TaxID=2975942 RepID=UPI0030869AE3|nr:hypothetical protein OIE54_10635 [Streptomyces sp. NBC_01794]